MAVLRCSFVDGVFANGWHRPKVQSFECRPVQLFRFPFADVEVNAWKWSRKSNTTNLYDKTSIGRVSLCLLYMTFQAKKRHILRKVLQGCMKSAYHGRFDRKAFADLRCTVNVIDGN